MASGGVVRGPCDPDLYRVQPGELIIPGAALHLITDVGLCDAIRAAWDARQRGGDDA